MSELHMMALWDRVMSLTSRLDSCTFLQREGDNDHSGDTDDEIHVSALMYLNPLARAPRQLTLRSNWPIQSLLDLAGNSINQGPQGAYAGHPSNLRELSFPYDGGVMESKRPDEDSEDPRSGDTVTAIKTSLSLPRSRALRTCCLGAMPVTTWNASTWACSPCCLRPKRI